MHLFLFTSIIFQVRSLKLMTSQMKPVFLQCFNDEHTSVKLEAIQVLLTVCVCVCVCVCECVCVCVCVCVRVCVCIIIHMYIIHVSIHVFAKVAEELKLVDTDVVFAIQDLLQDPFWKVKAHAIRGERSKYIKSCAYQFTFTIIFSSRWYWVTDRGVTKGSLVDSTIRATASSTS